MCCLCGCPRVVWKETLTWSWPIEAQDSEVKVLWFLETHWIRISNYVKELEMDSRLSCDVLQMNGHVTLMWRNFYIFYWMACCMKLSTPTFYYRYITKTTYKWMFFHYLEYLKWFFVFSPNKFDQLQWVFPLKHVANHWKHTWEHVNGFFHSHSSCSTFDFFQQ